MPIYFFLLAILLSLTHNNYTSHALSSISNSNKSNAAALSARLQNIQTELLVFIGRIPGTAMPPEWAASGAKLGFALEVKFTDKSSTEYEIMTREQLLQGDALMGSNFNLMRVEPLNEPSFVSANGREVIKVLPGAWGCSMQDVESKQYAFRFFLDFPKGARRNDVELPAERIYFLSSCWLMSKTSSSGEDDDNNNNSLERAQKRKEKLMYDIELTNARLNKIRSTPKSENILGSIVQSAFQLRGEIILVERRKKLQSELDELTQNYPLDSTKVIEGPNNIVFAREGVVGVRLSRGGIGGTREQYHWVGTFSYNEFFGDGKERI